MSVATINRAVDGFSYSVKRVRIQPERRNDDEAIEARISYAKSFLELVSTVPAQSILFIDEVGFNISMRTRLGRSLRGTRAVQVVPSLRSRNISICCAMNNHQIVYYCAQTKPYNKELFCEFLGLLFEMLRLRGIEHTVLVMDNVPFHKCSNVQVLIEKNGNRVIFLPPYSPFLNPIENMFSKWKECVRSERPADEDHLMSLIEDGAELITSEDCAGFYRNMMSCIERCAEGQPIEDV